MSGGNLNFVSGLPALGELWQRQSVGNVCDRRVHVVVSAGRRGGSRGRPRKFDGGLRDDKGGRRRPTRVGELYRRELSQIVNEELANAPRSAGLGSSLVSVLGVDVSPDLRNATIKVSIYRTEDQYADTLSYLKGRRKTIRTILSQRMKEMKSVPELRFVESDVESSFRTLEVLKKLADERGVKEEVSFEGADFDLQDDDMDSIILDDDEGSKDSKRTR